MFTWIYFFPHSFKSLCFYPETEKVYSKMIVKSIFRCGKTINSPKIETDRKQLCKEWSHAKSRTARGDDNNNSNTHLFSLLSVNKFKRSLLNFLIKHMVNASSCTAELWMHSGDSGLLSLQQLEELRIVYWRHQRTQWENEGRSRYWIWLGEFSRYVIMNIWVLILNFHGSIVVTLPVTKFVDQLE